MLCILVTTVPMLTMRPPSGMCGAAACAMYSVLKVLRANALCTSSGVRSTNSLPWPEPAPALLT
jgi:hypothetical protein